MRPSALNTGNRFRTDLENKFIANLFLSKSQKACPAAYFKAYLYLF